MPLKCCHIYTSEDIEVILESQMNSEKWHTGPICQFVSEALNELQYSRLLPANSAVWPPLRRARDKSLKLHSPYKLHE